MYNGGRWTQARYNSFIKSALRSASQRWPPRYETLNDACVGQRINPASGRLAKFYTCNGCKQIFPAKDVEVNHKIPVVPTEGFDNWDNVIKRMYCEKEGLETLCKPCHRSTTKRESEERKANKY